MANKREERISTLESKVWVLEHEVDGILHPDKCTPFMPSWEWHKKREKEKQKEERIEKIDKLEGQIIYIINELASLKSKISQKISKTIKEEKIYLVTFNAYTNCLNDTVSNGETEIDKLKYINIPEGGLLVKESELDKYAAYGNGFASIKYVGSILEDKNAQ